MTSEFLASVASAGCLVFCCCWFYFSPRLLNGWNWAFPIILKLSMKKINLKIDNRSIFLHVFQMCRYYLIKQCQNMTRRQGSKEIYLMRL